MSIVSAVRAGKGVSLPKDFYEAKAASFRRALKIASLSGSDTVSVFVRNGAAVFVSSGDAGTFGLMIACRPYGTSAFVLPIQPALDAIKGAKAVLFCDSAVRNAEKDTGALFAPQMPDESHAAFALRLEEPVQPAKHIHRAAWERSFRHYPCQNDYETPPWLKNHNRRNDKEIIQDSIRAGLEAEPRSLIILGWLGGV